MCLTVDVIEVVRRQEFSQHLQVVTLNGLRVQSYFGWCARQRRSGRSLLPTLQLAAAAISQTWVEKSKEDDQ